MEKVVVHSTTGLYAQEVCMRNHMMLADATVEEGGENKGPTPHEYLAAALGGCTMITMKMYAKRKNIDVGNTEVSVKVIHEGEKTIFEREIFFARDLSREDKDKLIGIANKCPIHKTLHSRIEIQTTEI